MKNLPQEVIAEILSWLPAKSLFRFRSVCKSWCSLISNNHFIHLHVNHSIQSDKLSVFFKYSQFFFALKSPMDIYSPEDHPASQFHFPFHTLNSMIEVVGSCNGLLCLSTFPNSIFLFDPTTRYYAQLPQNLVQSSLGHSFIRHPIYGFGYSSLAHTYKVLRIAYHHLAGSPVLSYKSEIQVHTVGTDSWRTITNTSPGDIRHRSSGTLLNGYVHWLGTSYVIVSFDVQNENFGVIRMPEFDDGNYKMTYLCQSRGCLCVFRNLNEKDVELWVMKEYGVNESWTLQFTIRQPAILGSPTFFKPFRVLYNDKALLRKSNGKLVIYDPSSESSREIRVRGLDEFFVITDYVESLVSINIAEPPSA